MTIRGGFMTRLQGEEQSFRFSELDRQALGLLWRYARAHRGRLALALVATLTAAAGFYADAIGKPDLFVLRLFAVSLLSAALAILTAHTTK